MASLIKKTQGGKKYYYLVESARVGSRRRPSPTISKASPWRLPDSDSPPGEANPPHQPRRSHHHHHHHTNRAGSHTIESNSLSIDPDESCDSLP